MFKPLHIKDFTKDEETGAYVSDASKCGLGSALHLIHVAGLNPNKPEHSYAFTLVSKDETKAEYIAQPVPLLQGPNRPRLTIHNA